MNISSHFDSGNIEVIKSDQASDIQLKIRKDSNSEFLQWFHFRAQGLQDQDCKFKIMNAADCSYIEGWEKYKAVATYDRQNFFRVPTEFNGNELIISHRPEYNSVFYSYFAPYSYERHLDLLHFAQQSDICELIHLGESVDGRDHSMLQAGNPSGKKFWIIARQHPGESMAEWFMEGFLNRLLDENDAVSKELLAKMQLFIVPNMNPDGAARGNLRSNAAGANLNREWVEPSMEKSPEVFLVRQKMKDSGVDLFMDIHGDEALPYNFISACEGNPSYTEKQNQLENEFIRRWIDVNPDFQDNFGYDKDEPGKADLRIATNYVGETFDCCAMTVEMPFKDNADHPDVQFGWSPERCMNLGESSLTVIQQMIEKF